MREANVSNNYNTTILMSAVINGLITLHSENTCLSEMQATPSLTPQINPYKLNQFINSRNTLNQLNYPTKQQKPDDFTKINNKLKVMSDDIVQLKDIIKC